MSQELFNYLSNELGATALESNLIDIKRIVKSESKNEPTCSCVSLQSAMNEIENAMERWHLARDNDGETLEKINRILVGIGRLGWFNRNDR